MVSRDLVPMRERIAGARGTGKPLGLAVDSVSGTTKQSLPAVDDQTAGQVTARAGLGVNDLSATICPVLHGNRKYSTQGQNDANGPKAVIGRSTVLRMPISRSRLGTLPLKSPEPMLSSKNCSNFQEDHRRSRLHSKNKNLLCEM